MPRMESFAAYAFLSLVIAAVAWLATRSQRARPAVVMGAVLVFWLFIAFSR